MVIVPAFSKGQQSYPEAVFRIIVSEKSLRTPHVSSRVYQPGSMESDGDAKEDAPHYKRQSTDGHQDQTHQDRGHPMPFADEGVKLVFAKIGYIR